MIEDPILEEARAARQQLWNECGQDFKRLAEFVRAAQQRYPERVVNREQLRQLMQAREAAGVPPLPKEPPYEDPIVEEIHRIRQEIAEERSKKSGQSVSKP